jgi:hypothetical protein
VHLKKFSLVSPKIPSTEIFKAIEIAIPASAIEQAITKTNVEEKRYRTLPAQLIVCLVIAMSLWSKDSIRDVLKNLIDGLNEPWIKIGKYWCIHVYFGNYSSQTKIRSRRDETVVSFCKCDQSLQLKQ